MPDKELENLREKAKELGVKNVSRKRQETLQKEISEIEELNDRLFKQFEKHQNLKSDAEPEFDINNPVHRLDRIRKIREAQGTMPQQKVVKLPDYKKSMEYRIAKGLVERPTK